MKCEHDKERSRCRECDGGSFCPHDIIRGTCSLCEPEKVFVRLQRQAKGRGLKFELSWEQFTKIVFQNCFYCNDYSRPRGIDRIKNSESYTLVNSRACCGRCNRWKSNESVDVFLGHVRKIAEQQEKLRRLKTDHPGSVGVASAHTPVLFADKQSEVCIEELEHVSEEI